MNKIQVEDVKDEEINYILEEDSVIIIKNSNAKINYTVNNNIKVFILIESSNLELLYDTTSCFDLNIFSVNSSLNIITNLNKDDLKFNYAYSTINEKSNN